MKILDLGCGTKKFSGELPEDTIVGLDTQKIPGVDVVHDMEKAPLPFDDESFDVVYSHHSLEHIRNRLQLVDEVWRILKPAGVFDVTVPHHSNPVGESMVHYGYFGMQAFDELTNKGKENYIRGRFNLVERKIKLIRPFRFLEAFANRFPDFYEWRLTWMIPAVEVSFKLRKIGIMIKEAPVLSERMEK